MTDRETTDAALAAERAGEDSEDVAQDAALKQAQDDLAAAQATIESERTAEAAEDVQQNATIQKALRDIAALQAEVDDLKSRISTTGASIGASLPLNNLFGNTVEFVRIFLQGDAAIPLGGVPQDAEVMVSRKTRGAWFGTRLAAAKLERPDIKLYGVLSIHEPEDNVKRGEMTADGYKAECREDVPIIKGAGAVPVQVLMGGSVNDGTASQFWITESDQIWYDVYHGGAGRVPSSYKAPETWLKPYFDAATAAGKPMGFAEFGSRTTAADAENYAAPAYLQWVKDNSAYCRSHPTLLAAAWFNFGGARIRFQNQAMADAWLK